MPRPLVLTKCQADSFTDKSRERIVEFTDRKTGLGGLISFRRQDDGMLDVHVYRLDPKVRIFVDKANLGLPQ
jgi:hypothetical protein